MNNEDMQQLKALAIAATPQDFDSAERVDVHDGSTRECPLCCGDGELELEQGYCNYDNAAIGVDFYGVGPEHKTAESYYRAANPKAILALIARIESLAADAERYQWIVENKHVPWGAFLNAHQACAEGLDATIDAAIAKEKA